MKKILQTSRCSAPPCNPSEIKKQKSFTLLEAIVYLAIFSLIIAVLTSFVLWFFHSIVKVKSMRESLENAEKAMRIMALEIKEAKNIYTPTTTSNQLTLETTRHLPEGEESTYISFYKCWDTRICFKPEGSYLGIITSNDVEITNLVFTRIGNSAVKIDLTIKYQNPDDRPEYRASVNLTSTVSLRSYVEAPPPDSISSCLELQNMKNDLSGSYYLTQDVDCSDTVNWNDGAGFEPVGDYPDEFTGSFDGAGFVISNIFINRPSEDLVGLFGQIGSGVTIIDVGLENIDITGYSFVGGITGYNNGGSIQTSYTTGTLKGDYYALGGLAGNQEDGSISNCYSTVDISKFEAGSSVNYAGGLIGYMRGGSIDNSYAIGDIEGSGNMGGLTGKTGGLEKSAIISNSFATGGITVIGDGSGVGGITAGNYGSLTNVYWNNHANNPDDCYEGGNDGCTAISNNEAYFYDNTNFPLAFWDFFHTPIWGIDVGVGYPCLLWQSGCSAASAPLPPGPTISSCLELQNMKNDLSGSYYLTQDIDCSDTVNWHHYGGDCKADFSDENGCNSQDGCYWIGGTDGCTVSEGFEPVGTIYFPFTGTFDGQGHTISNLHINRYWTDDVGLFGYTGSGSVIKDVGMENVNFIGLASTGGLVGQNHGDIMRCYATGEVYSDYSAVGGLVGDNAGTISNSYASVNANERGEIGGLVGNNDLGAIISNSYATGNVYARENPAGGLVGYNQGTIENSFSTGDATGGSGDPGDSNYLGGLAGVNGANGVITTSYFYEHAQPSVCVGLNEGGSVDCIPKYTESYFYDNTNFPLAFWDFFHTPIWGTVDNDYPCLMWESGCTAPPQFTKPISTCEQLQDIRYYPGAGHYLTQDIDCSQTSGWNWDGSKYLGFDPIGDDYGNLFAGYLDGQNFKITNLYINRPTEDYVALFGGISGPSEIRNIGLENVNIIGQGRVAGLIANIRKGPSSISHVYGDNALVNNVYVTGSVTGANDVGGLIGFNEDGEISNCYSTVSVSGGNTVGGLVGYNVWYIDRPPIINCYAIGDVSVSVLYGGGLVGENNGGSIDNSFATGTVTGPDSYGLIGHIENYGTDTNSYCLDKGIACGGSASAVSPESYFYDNNNAPMTSWDFSTIWDIDVGVSYPCFLWQGGCQAALPPSPTPTPTPS